MGGLIADGNYKMIVSDAGNSSIYKIDFIRDQRAIIKVVGEGNTNIADDYSVVVGHGNGPELCITHNSGPFMIKMYRDNDYNYYVYVKGWGYTMTYFDNRVPGNNTISATKVNIDVDTLTQVGI